MKYARLTFLSSDSLHRKGEVVYVGGNRRLIVGQSQSCDLVLPGNPDFEDEMFFVLQRMKSDDGWCIIVHRNSAGVYVDGISVPFAAAVYDGSRISVGRTELVFSEIEPQEGLQAGDFSIEKKFAKIERRQRIVWAVSLLVIACLIVNPVIKAFKDKSITFTQSDDAFCRSATYKVCIEMVYLEEKTSEGWKTKDSTAALNGFGSAVLVKNSKDSLFVLTARHCVQPWLSLPPGPELMEKLDRPPYSWVVMSENSTHGVSGPEYRMNTECSLKDRDDSLVYRFKSRECIIDMSRDLAVDFRETDDSMRWWRMITPVFHDRSMQLGDFALLSVSSDCFSEGKALPLGNMPNAPGFEIYLYGYMYKNEKVTQNHEEAFLPFLGYSMESAASFTVLANEGYSGGPFVMKKDGRLSVVAILSKETQNSKSSDFLAIPSNVISPIAESPDTVIEVRRHKR